MLVVRDAQLLALGGSDRGRFTAAVEVHVRAHFRARCEALGPDEVRAAVAQGVARANARGLESERDVCRFVDLIFVFGWELDDPEVHPWAARAFARGATSTERLESLFDAAVRRAHRARGIQRSGGAEPR